MAVNFSTMVLSHCFNLYSRPITVVPTASQPGMPAYRARAIYDSRTMNVALDDSTILSDQDTTIDIMEEEFATLPVQGDGVVIDVDPISLLPRLGQFVVDNVWNDGGGETTLQMKKVGD
jgi:hypothetical protein